MFGDEPDNLLAILAPPFEFHAVMVQIERRALSQMRRGASHNEIEICQTRSRTQSLCRLLTRAPSSYFVHLLYHRSRLQHV